MKLDVYLFLCYQDFITNKNIFLHKLFYIFFAPHNEKGMYIYISIRILYLSFKNIYDKFKSYLL